MQFNNKRNLWTTSATVNCISNVSTATVLYDGGGKRRLQLAVMGQVFEILGRFEIVDNYTVSQKN